MDEQADPIKKESELRSDDLYNNLQDMMQTKEERENTRKQHIRTYESDIAEEVRGKNMSVIQIALAEQKRQEQHLAVIKKSKTQTVLYLVLAMIAVIGAVSLIAWAFSYREATVPIPNTSTPRVNSIVFSEDQIPVDVTNFSRTELLQSIVREIDFISSPGITNIIPVTYATNPPRALSGEEFISQFALNVPETLPIQFRDDYMLGYLQNTDDVFIILKFTDFDIVLDAMRTWEDFLVQDFTTLLGLGPFANADIMSQEFESEILFNKISRSVRNREGDVVMVYTFMDRRHLVLASKPQTIEEVLNRFGIQAIR